jgi:hypothetical protein
MRRTTPSVQVEVGLGHVVGEPQLKVLAAQGVGAVVLDEVVQAGEQHAVGQEVAGPPLLQAGRDPTVLHPATAPGR